MTLNPRVATSHIHTNHPEIRQKRQAWAVKPAVMAPVLTPVVAAIVAIMAIAGWSARSALAAREGQLVLTVVDAETGKPIPCRMHLKNAKGKPQRQPGLPFWHDHFVLPGKVTLRLPLGNYTFELERGPEYVTRGGHFRIDKFADDTKTIDLKRFVDMSKFGWWSGDIDVRRPPGDIELLMAADDLHVAEVITWFGNTNSWKGKSMPKNPLVRFDGDRYYHLMGGAVERAGTTLLLLGLPKPLPTTGGGEYPPSIKYAIEARQQPAAWVELSKPFWWDLPMLVANRQIDSIQIAHSHICRESVIGNEADGKPRDRL
ncbi:MAG: hypothetical protein V3V75_00285, partial [Thermoguttaceae bacterium]